MQRWHYIKNQDDDIFERHLVDKTMVICDGAIIDFNFLKPEGEEEEKKIDKNKKNMN